MAIGKTWKVGVCDGRMVCENGHQSVRVSPFSYDPGKANTNVGSCPAAKTMRSSETDRYKSLLADNGKVWMGMGSLSDVLTPCLYTGCLRGVSNPEDARGLFFPLMQR